MPVDLATPFRHLLSRIVTISQEIRSSALEHANDQNFDTSERLRRQLETIRTSADVILHALAKASLTSYSLDDRMTNWLASEEPHVCLNKLKEMKEILGPVFNTEDPAPSLTPAEDQLAAAMAFFDNHEGLFHFLLTPDVWNRERAPPNVTATGDENGPQSAQARKIDRKKEVLHQKLGEILRWLAPMECIQKHKDALRLRQEGTCKWFPNTNVYERWRAPGNHFLWLHGKGGCGKSVLMAYTIDHLKIGLEEEEVVVFFYCDFRNKRSTSSTELMRSLLSQLLRHIRDRGVDPGDFPDKVLQQKSEGTLSLDDLEKLCDLVSRAASFFRYEPMVVIDALDECADIERLLPVLVTLGQSSVRLLVTSRLGQTIMDHFAGLQSLSFENVTEEIAADIALHVRRELGSHRCLRSAISQLKNEIDVKLIRKADGRFRWVQCQLDTLKRCPTKEELKEALDCLPNELGATYERILGAIDERKSEGELARRVLALLMVALEPLQVAQIVDGLSMDFQERKHNVETQQWLETKLLPSLSSLVSYYEETDVLALSHHSVKEYLTSRSALPMYQIAFHQAHAKAVHMCMGYISVYLKSDSSHRNLESFPMVFYVLSSGFNHLAYVDSESSIALEALQSLGLDVQHHPSHWDRLCELREEILEWPFTPWPSSKHDFVLYVLIAYSSSGLLRTFLSSSPLLQPRIKTNPLVYAADLRKTEHAMVLLAHGADVNVHGLVIDDSYCSSPLEVAIDLGDDMLVGELLRKECLVTSELLATAVCIPWCSTQVLVKLMQTDEFAEWALGIGGEKLYRGIFNSARPNAGDSRKTDGDHVALARRLSQFCPHHLSEGQFGKDLIMRALHAAHTSMLDFLLSPHQPPAPELLIIASTGDTSETVTVVRFLLQRGVNVHAVSDASGDTALHLAVMCPWEPRSLELAKLLVHAGCNLHALNSDGETPLVVAVQHGHCLVVDFLLSCDAPLPPNILHTALRRRRNPRMIGFSQMIGLLLERGADAHAIAPYTGNTSLHDAIVGPKIDGDEKYEETECFNLVKCLLEAGCDPTTYNSAGESALELAIDHKFTSVVDLLSSDVPLPSNILLIASWKHWTLEIIKSLIHRGADVNPTTSNGDTPLHLALTEHYTDGECCELVKILVDAGCDPALHNSTGETALGKAIIHEYTSVVEFLLSCDVPLPCNILLIALHRRCAPEMIESLIRRGADVHSITPDGDTALHLALKVYDIEKECRELMKRFMDAGCNPIPRNSTGETVLEIAIAHGYTSTVELLLSYKVPLPSNVLLVALWQHSTSDMVEFLIQKGANVHSTAANGDTVLHLALTQYYIEDECYKLVKRFIDAGCNPISHNSTGETVLGKAIMCGYISVVKLLLFFDVPLPLDVLWIALLRPQHSTLDTVELLIQNGADVQSTNPLNGDTILHLALDFYHLQDCRKLAKILIGAGCNPSLRNSGGKTVIVKAIECGDTSILVELLLSPSDVSLPPDVLLIALEQRSSPEVIQLLIQYGADVHATTTNGDTVLHLALTNYIERECCKLTKNLVDAGCHPTTPDSFGETVLEIAIRRGHILVVELLLSFSLSIPSDILPSALLQHADLQMIEFLISKGADVHCKTSDGDTLLHLALKEYDMEEECLDLVTAFMNAGCNPATYNSDGETALEIAIEREFISITELLFSADAPAPSNIIIIALQWYSTLEVVECLIYEGANVHCTTSSGDTVLHLALEYDIEEECCGLVKRFMDAGCDPNPCDSTRKTLLEVAIERRYASVVEHLLSCNVPLLPDALLIALRQHSTLEMVQFLVQRGANLYSTTSNGDTALHLALTKYSVERECCGLVECLVDAGCNPISCNSEGKTVLELSIERKFTSVVDLLIPRFVPVPSDVLLFALQRRSPSVMVQLLIEKGVNVHHITSSGDTVLHLALTEYDIEEECCDLVEKFVHAGCHTTARNSTGETALEIAIGHGYTPVVDILLSNDFMVPPDILLIALRQRSTLKMIQFIIQKAANVHSTTSNGSTALHLALSEYCIEGECCELVRALMQAGCDATACRSDGKTVLVAAIERGYISVIQLLLQPTAPLSSDILAVALRCCSTPQIIQFLVDKFIAHENLAVQSGSDWDSLLQLARASYHSGSNRQQVTEILESARKARRVRLRFGDEAYMHVAKRPRLK